MNTFKLHFSGLLATLLILFSGCSKTQTMNASVLNGDDVPANTNIARSTVAIGRYEQGKFKVTCSGTLISKDIVLTAAHCVIPFEMNDIEISLYFGNDRINYDTSLEQTASKWIYNPGYSKVRSKDGSIVTGINDIAVVKFDRPLPANFIPASIIAGNKTLELNSQLTVAGWGTTVDKKSQIPQKLQQASVQLYKYWYSHLIIDQRGGTGVCNGDSGGPAYIEKEDGSLTVVGVTRGAYNNAEDCSELAEFTNVSAQIEFILNAISDLNGSGPKIDENLGSNAQ